MFLEKFRPIGCALSWHFWVKLQSNLPIRTVNTSRLSSYLKLLKNTSSKTIGFDEAMHEFVFCKDHCSQTLLET